MNISGALPKVGEEPNEEPNSAGPAPDSRTRRLAATPVVGALGVVFGDIGTSPLYSLQTAFSVNHNEVKVTQLDVYGIISLVVWSLIIVVTLKYVVLVMRADNDGEGGILALTALLRGRLSGVKLRSTILVIGMVGAALFFGDSLITPAISVMSAMEGLQVARPGLEGVVLPGSLIVLTILFMVQRFGTGKVGRAFGPVMIVWFVSLAILGVPQIVRHPAILLALSPTYAAQFWIARPGIAFVAMTAVVLTITGAEALYADMGHFGAGPIRRAWFGLVLVSLLLNYMGQGAMIMDNPRTIDNPFFHLAPEWARIPLVVLATAATVIASQAVISGAYSMAHQATRLGLLPNLRALHTSNKEYGQIYLPAVNWMLFAGVVALMFGFRSSNALASAYGLSVTGMLVTTTGLLTLMAIRIWHWPMWRVLLRIVPVAALELLFLAANMTKIVHGGWLPLTVALILVTVMATWMTGNRYVLRRRGEIEGPLTDFLTRVRAVVTTRVVGEAVYLHANPKTAPLALKENVRFNRALHERVYIVRMKTASIPRVADADRFRIDELPEHYSGLYHLTITFGFQETRDIPGAIAAIGRQCPQLKINPDEIRYFASVMTLTPGGDAPMNPWRKHLYIWLARNATPRGEAFHLPPNRTMLMGGTLQI
ncbi:KUP/HAK/KT family potassium transporter [Brooklawnia sp.]|uniref:potassium transporter Kup n=1 Tax=Brooklawnia sp. TaxID=2699740 RepID=UPI00311DB4F6